MSSPQPPILPPSFNADSTLGAMLIGVLLSYLLFGVTTTQVYMFARRFPDESGRMKWLVRPGLSDVAPNDSAFWSRSPLSGSVSWPIWSAPGNPWGSLVVGRGSE
ncbi:hypothetical protein B0H19DRAFT_1272702 [Mycena capillaripes]|nr:hypothetical protein B0H19DRAFT_1272702 [Mycena capillaripes]